MSTTAEWIGPWQRRLGELTLTCLTDRTYLLDGGAFFGVVPKTLWSKEAPADEYNRIRAGMNSLLVDVAGRRVLIETGCGNKLDEKTMRHAGVDPRRDFLRRLTAAGCEPPSVDVVINSHLHFDHCGWNTVLDESGALQPAFVNAEYCVQRVELEHAREQRERDRVSYLPPNYEPLLAAGRMHLLEGEVEILPGVSVEVLSGHTRGMQAILLRSAGETACYISDLMPTHWHLRPTWLMAFDLYPLETIANKHRVLERAAREHWLMVLTHDPQMPWGFVEHHDGTYRFVPA